MNEDPRIILVKNEENKGMLHSIIIGVLNAKGKYIKIIDADDFLSFENSLSIMYEEIEKNNLDILGFGATQGQMNMTTYEYIHTSFHDYFETTPIIYQPELSEKSYDKIGNGYITRAGDVLWTYIFRRDLFIKAIKEIDEKFLKIIHNVTSDNFLFFYFNKIGQIFKIY